MMGVPFASLGCGGAEAIGGGVWTSADMLVEFGAGGAKKCLGHVGDGSACSWPDLMALMRVHVGWSGKFYIAHGRCMCDQVKACQRSRTLRNETTQALGTHSNHMLGALVRLVRRAIIGQLTATRASVPILMYPYIEGSSNSQIVLCPRLHRRIRPVCSTVGTNSPSP